MSGLCLFNQLTTEVLQQTRAIYLEQVHACLESLEAQNLQKTFMPILPSSSAANTPLNATAISCPTCRGLPAAFYILMTSL